jgi:hypothetical protein
LSTNAISEIKHHQAPVTVMTIFKTYLLSGDASGVVKVFNIGDFSQVMEGRANQGPNHTNAAITSICLIEKPCVGIVVVAGDVSGYITLIKMEQQGVKCATYGAHADSK